MSMHSYTLQPRIEGSGNCRGRGLEKILKPNSQGVTINWGGGVVTSYKHISIHFANILKLFA